MSRWFRHYAGMMRDDKLVRAALKSRQTVERVVWVWGAILESAAEIDDAGRYEIDAAEIAYFLRADEADILSILESLEGLGRIHAGSVAKWGDRQFQSDRSAERQKRYRDKRASRSDEDANPSRDGGVTVASRHSDAPEAETDTDTEEETKDAASAASSAGAPVLDLQEAERRCCEAAASDRLGSFAPIAELLHRQADLDRDILPALRARPAPKNGIQSWRYYAPIISEAMAKRAPPASASGLPKVFIVKDTPEWAERVAAGHKPGMTTQHPQTKAEGWYFSATQNPPNSRSNAA
ncbi:hypothetical protein IED13_00985 [Bosea sp. SSUT16]|uniref:DUF1376 domain-containing protein n=1 Tax=Bosea spartocytisi TaxID=2773451 RepID=A0A927E4I7_9HYPH|nr:hypothetical protein [Bosea spartocytisi]MBD3844253.1 hypothetical protein [Bosea spartocytisi]MCT4470639.1 hypothetical protein [Bosea spartocytisi]